MRRLRWLFLGFVVLGLLLPPPAGAVPGGGRQPFPERFDLPNGFQPEGITTGRGTTVFVGSLADGDLWRGDVRTGRGSVFAQGTGKMAVGLDYDRRRDLVWVAGGATGTVRAHDAVTGAEVASYTFAGRRFLNDLVVTRDAVYVTDSMNAVLAVVRLGSGRQLPGQDATRTLPLRGDYAHVRDAFNANGIVSSEGFLVLVQSVTGNLFRVDPGTGRARRIDLGGRSLTNGDGLEIEGSTLYVVRNQNNLVAVVQLRDDLRRGRVVDTLREESFDVPTTITVAAGRLWAVNARFGTPPTPETTYWVTQVSR